MTRKECDLSAFPPELIEAVKRDAESDADAVGRFLAALGVPSSPDQPLSPPSGALLKLGAALHLLRWEAAGHQVHRQAGLPSADDMIREAILELSQSAENGSKPDGPSLSLAVMRLGIDHFAWSGQAILQADVALDFPDEDSLVEALAAFVWTHRHDFSPLVPNPADEPSS